MLFLRIATAMAALISLAAVVLCAVDDPIDRPQSALIAGASISATVGLYCTYKVITAMHTVRDQILKGVAEETRRLHRAVATVIDQYGDIRAIDAMVAVEHRHASGGCNPAPDNRSAQTVDLRDKAANVSLFRRR